MQWMDVDRELKAVARRRAEMDAEELPWLLAAERMEVHRHLGFGSWCEYIERVFGYTPRVAMDRLRVAKALESRPHMAAELAAGRLKYSAVRELAHCTRADTEDAWIERAAGKTVREVEDLARGHVPGDLPDDPS